MRRLAVSTLLVALFVSLVGFVVHRRLGPHHDEAATLEPADTTPTEAPADDGEAVGTEHATTSDPAAQEATEPAAVTVEPSAPGEPEAPLAESPDAVGAESPEAPITEPTVTTPTTEPAVTAPIAEPAVTAPIAEPTVTAPIAQPAVVAPDGTPAEGAPPGPNASATRPLRVIATDWESVAPILLAAGGARTRDGSILARAGIAHELRVASSTDELEEALARGGADERGADVAVLPLARWVASYEHLAALETEAFFVGAWSRGSQLVYASPDASPSERLPTAISVAAERDTAASLSLLVLLAEMDVRPERVRFTGPDDARALFMTTEREAADATSRSRDRALWLSSADATHLAPWVVIAPRAFLRAEQPRLTAWARAWLEGSALLSRDVPAAARTIAAIQGAPPLIELLRRLGQLEPIGLAEQAELVGLSGRSAMSLEALFRRAWAIDRAVGVLSGPPPPSVPVASGTIAALLRHGPPARARVTRPAAPPQTRVLATFPLALPRTPRVTEPPEPTVARLAFVAAVFSRSGLVLSVPRDRAPLAEALVARAVELYGLDPTRVEITTGATPSLRVLSPG